MQTLNVLYYNEQEYTLDEINTIFKTFKEVMPKDSIVACLPHGITLQQYPLQLKEEKVFYDL